MVELLKAKNFPKRGMFSHQPSTNMRTFLGDKCAMERGKQLFRELVSETKEVKNFIPDS